MALLETVFWKYYSLDSLQLPGYIFVIQIKLGAS